MSISYTYARLKGDRTIQTRISMHVTSISEVWNGCLFLLKIYGKLLNILHDFLWRITLNGKAFGGQYVRSP